MAALRYKLRVQDNQILRVRRDGAEEVVAELREGASAEHLALLFAAAPLLEQRVRDAARILDGFNGQVGLDEEDWEKISWAVARLRHSLRAARGQAQGRCGESCALSPAPGGRYCEVHTTDFWNDRLCGVRDCPLEPTFSHDTHGILFCKGHSRRYEIAGDIEILTWLAQQPPGAPQEADPTLPPSTIPGLGSALTRSGLPAGFDPRAIEAALLEGPARCVAGSCGAPRVEGRVWCEEHARQVDDLPK